MRKVTTCQSLITRLDKLSRSVFVYLRTPYFYYGPVWMFWIFSWSDKTLVLIVSPYLAQCYRNKFHYILLQLFKKNKMGSITSVFTHISELIYGDSPHKINDMQIQLAFTFRKCFDVYFPSMFNEIGSGLRLHLLIFYWCTLILK